MATTTFANLVCAVVRVPNPQHEVNGEAGEQRLLEWVCDWLTQHGIPHEADASWGIHAVLTGPLGAGHCPGILLSGHLDSDQLKVDDLVNVRVEGSSLVCPGSVGLDCKTGVAIALSVLDRLRGDAEMPRQWQVHALFTIGEEAGQKGAFRAPLPRLIGGRVRHAIVIDRQTRGSGAPTDAAGRAVRHVVTEYKGVPLLDASSGRELLEHLANGHARAGGGIATPLPTCVSPNCADALELRGRWDAEVAGNLKSLEKDVSPALAAALAEYAASTAVIAESIARVRPEQRVSSMNDPPRITRYRAMRRVHDALADKVALDSSLWFSVVNLSYDYDDACDTCSLDELDLTARLCLHTIQSYYAQVGSLVTGPLTT